MYTVFNRPGRWVLIHEDEEAKVQFQLCSLPLACRGIEKRTPRQLSSSSVSAFNNDAACDASRKYPCWNVRGDTPIR